MNSRLSSNHFTRLALSVVACAALLPAASATAQTAPSSVGEAIAAVQPRMVKIYGAGGYRGMEAYQSGFIVSAEGHILTAWSSVLDTDAVTVTLNDGQKLQAELVGADPRLEIAVLKIAAADLPYFDLAQAVQAVAGTRVLAFSNLFGVASGNEPPSVQHGVISVVTDLAARRGVFDTPYKGPVYVLDAVTNNPGAAGGALVTRRGELLGVLGKELRGSLNNTWLNYAVPIAELRESVEQIKAGSFVARDTEQEDTQNKPARCLTPALLGIVLVPDVMPRTPTYVDEIRSGSPAEAAGMASDDLVLLVGDRLVQSCKALNAELEYIDHEDPVKLTVLRDGELLEFTLRKPLEDEGTPQ